MKFEKVASYLTENGILSTDEVLEVRGFVEQIQSGSLDKKAAPMPWMRNLGHVVAEKIPSKETLWNFVALPTLVAGAAAEVAGTFGDITEPFMKGYRFRKMVAEHPEIMDIQVPDGLGRERPVSEAEVRRSFGVGHHLAPKMMANPTTAKAVTQNLLFTGMGNVSMMQDLTRTNKTLADKHRGGPGLGLQAMKDLGVMSRDNEMARRTGDNDPIEMIEPFVVDREEGDV